jgi:hypothetical protein
MSSLRLPHNPYIDRVTIQYGYELCQRCGHPIVNGQVAYVMWRAPEYGVFAHSHQCSTRKVRGWTSVLKYEQVNETLAWNSERVPEIVSPLTVSAALATLPAQTRAFEYQAVGKRKNRFSWTWTPGDPNWRRTDHWNGKEECVPGGKVETDFLGGSSTVTIQGRTFPFVSLLDWNHIQNETGIVDIELTKERPELYASNKERDGIPASDKVRQRTAVAIHDHEGLTAVTRNIICQNREEQSMLLRLGIRHLFDVVEAAKKQTGYSSAENARESMGKISWAYHQDRYVPRPETVKVVFPRPSTERALERLIYASTIRREREKSYGKVRYVDAELLKVWSRPIVRWAVDKRTAQQPKRRAAPKHSGPGAAQSWDVFGNPVEYALYSDAPLRIFENGVWRRLTHDEYLEWETRQIRRTMVEVPSKRDENWIRLLAIRDKPDLSALVEYWDAYGCGSLGSWTAAYDRPWQWRETCLLTSQNNRGDFPAAEADYFDAFFYSAAEQGGIKSPLFLPQLVDAT